MTMVHSVNSVLNDFGDRFMNKKNIISALGITLLAAPLLFGCATKETPTDFDKMREAYKDYIIASNKKTIDENKDKSATELKEENKLKSKKIGTYDTYYIDGLDYNDDKRTSDYPPRTHILVAYKLAYIAEARGDHDIKELAIKMTYYWVFNNYRSANWWHNHLGEGGNTLSSLGLFVYDDLTDQGQMAMVSKIADASLYYHPSLLTHTGANLFDYVDITVKNSILTHNADEFEVAISRAEEEVTDKNLEGFQTDGCFFQHGQQVQTATNYGKSVKRLGNVLRTASRSSRKFDASKYAIIDNYLTRGLRGATHNGYFNYLEEGREICRRNAGDAKNNAGIGEYEVYTELDDYPKKEELKDFLDSVNNRTASVKEGEIIHYDKGKMVTANIGGVYMSFKGTAPNLTNTECVNGENELGLNLSYATDTCVLDSGDEYFSISPLWDYAYIPGTTTYNIHDKENGKNYDYAPEEIDKKIVGYTEGEGEEAKHIDGIRDIYKDSLYERQLPIPTEENGFVYSDKYDEANNISVFMQRSCHHDENYFTVTCIMCEYGMVNIGAEMTYDGKITGPSGLSPFFTSERTLHTTIDQNRKVGTLGDDNKTYTRGNVVYTSLDDKTFTQRTRLVRDVANETKDTADKNKYSWKRNASQTVFNEKDRDEHWQEWIQEGANIDTVFIEHNASENCKYAYCVQPTSMKNKKFEVKNNFTNNKVQEVKLPNGKIVIAAYEKVNDYQPSVGEKINLEKGDIIIR